MKKNIFTTVALCLTVFTANAGNCFSNYCEATLSKVYISPNTNIYIHADGDMGNLTCTLEQGGMVLRKSHEMHKEIYSALLSASMSQSEIKVRVNDSGPCALVYVMINR